MSEFQISTVRERPVPSFLYLVGMLAGGNVLASVLRVAGGILQARFVGPSVLGMFNSIGLIQGYLPFLQFGVLNGLNRELPYYVGKGEYERVKELAAAAQAWAIALGATVGMGLLGVAVVSLVRGDVPRAAGWATNALAAFLLFYSTTYLQVTYRTGHDFARLALVNVAQNAVALVLVALVALLSFYGLCLRASISTLVGAVMLHYWRPVRVGPKWNIRHWKHLLGVGLPIFGVGQLYAWWTVLDSTLVLKYLGETGMGLYALVLVAIGTVDLLPSAVSQIVYPRMAEQFGRTERIEDLLSMALKPMLLTVAGMVPVVTASWFLVEPVVSIVVPNFIEAVPAMQWSLLITIFSSFSPVYGTFLVVRRLDLYLVAVLLGMACYVGVLLLLVRNGASLIHFPQAMIAGRALFTITCYLLLGYLVRSRQRP